MSRLSRTQGISLLLIGLLSGCTFQTLDKALPELTGAPVMDAISILGIPDREYPILDFWVYEWRTHSTGSTLINSPTSGTVGSTPYYGSTLSAVPTISQCTIKLMTISDIIVSWEYSGNEGGCQAYADRLKPLAKQADLKKRLSDG